MTERVIYERYVQRPVKAEQHYRVDRQRGEVVFTHLVNIDGKQLAANVAVRDHELEMGLPVDYVERRLRRMLMDDIEKHIYGDVL